MKHYHRMEDALKRIQNSISILEARRIACAAIEKRKYKKKQKAQDTTQALFTEAK